MDEEGNESGENIIIYEDPVSMQANISAASGYSQTEQFGNLENYDKVIVTDDLTCSIDEHSVLFIDEKPSFTKIVTHSKTDDEIIVREINVPKYNYVVRRVAKSLNSISIAVGKVDVS